MNINKSAYGPLNDRYVTRMKKTLDNCLNAYPRTMVLRIDLHLPSDKIHIYRKDDGLVKKFIASLKSQIYAQYCRKQKAGTRVYQTNIRYIWVREFGQVGMTPLARDQESDKIHYHVALLLNKDAYAYPGSYVSQSEGYQHNLAFMIMNAWIRALNLHREESYEKYYPLVHFPEKPYYHLNTRDNDFGRILDEVIVRLEYLAKIYSKDNSDGYRNFGCSQG